MSIDYTKIDQDEVRNELISLMKRTDSFKDADFVGTVMYDFANNLSYVAALYGFLLNQVANEPFIDSAKQYKNINRISNSLMYNPVGKGSAKVNIASSISKDYVLKNTEGFIEIPAYSLFPSTTSVDGKNFSFTNTNVLSIQIKQFGLSRVKEADFKYVGDIFGGNLEPTKLKLDAFTKKPVHFVDPNNNIITFDYTLSSINDVDLIDFKVNTQYSLFIKNSNNVYSLVIGNKTTEIQYDEIARFKIDAKRKISFVQNFSNNRLYIGRLGFSNLEYTKIRAIPYPGIPNTVGRIELIVPKYVPAFQVLYNGEILTFSSADREVVISTDRIESSYFSNNNKINIVLEIRDVNAINYGAKLVLKTDSELLSSDVVIANIPSIRNVDSRGNLLIEDNTYIIGEVKTGVVNFSRGDVVKRVVFEKSFDFGLSTTSITPTSKKNYSVYLYSNSNIVTYYSDKTTRGFNAYVEDGVEFEGDVYWKCVAYERESIQSYKSDTTDYVNDIDSSNYAVIVQAGQNANVWVTDVTQNSFLVDTDSAFVGDVDFLIVENKDFSLTPEPKEVGQIYVPKGETEIEVIFQSSRADANYQVFLQPSNNVKVWFSRKTSNGFIINIEPETDFYGPVDWQMYSSKKTGTITFSGTSGFTNEPSILFSDLDETTNLGYIEQGLGKISLIDEQGLINNLVNGLTLEYNVDEDLHPGLSFEIKNNDISYNNIRVFVEDNDRTWQEYTESINYKRPIDKNSNVFYVRVNKDKYVDIKFGNDDFRGVNPKGHKIAIIGLETVGVYGNIGSNKLSTQIISALNFQNGDIVTDQVAANLLDVLRIKQEVFFNGQIPEILDYKGDVVSSNDLSIIQLDSGFSGTNFEGIEDVRISSQYAYRSQNRLVTKEDYQNALLKEFNGIIDSVEVFNYKDVQDNGIYDLGPEPSRYFNTLFIFGIPSYGKGFTLLQRRSIKRFIDEKAKKMTTIDSIILEPTFVEIDVIILYTTAVNASSITARNDILDSVYKFFERKNRSLGETISISNIRNAIVSNSVGSLEIQLKRDDQSQFNSSDYDVDITPNEYEDPFKSVEDKKLDDAVKRELRNLIGKGLVEIKQPLFDIQYPNGDRKWTFINDIQLGRFEFPVLGDVVIERKV
jgi:hypothetical protein